MNEVSSRFAYETETARIVFGAGAIRCLPDELRVPNTRIVLIGTPGRDAEIKLVSDILGSAVVGVYNRAAMHVPVTVMREALDLVHRHAADCIIAVGGGSAIGVGKAVVREARLALVAIPTTYSGSEMTSVWGVTEGEAKRTGRDPGVAPALVIYDPELTLSLPVDVSAASGMNAVAHCVEALYAPEASPVSTMLATDGLEMLGRALPRVVADPRELTARNDALFGSHFAGYALHLTTTGLHHKLAHVLGGMGLPHAPTHATLLAHVARFNAPAAPEAMGQIADALDASDGPSGIAALGERLGLRYRLGDLGLRREDINRAAESVAKVEFPNPRPVTREDVVGILERAF